MNFICPIHQFEVRFTPILNFPYIIKETLAPFVGLSNRIHIQNEGSVNEKITLYFDSEHYEISIMWDRVIFKSEGDFFKLSNNNSILEEPFFNVLSKIKKLSTFGSLNNYLLYVVIVNPLDRPLKEIVDIFSKKHFSNFTIDLSKDITDGAIVLENVEENLKKNITFGPYIGIEDLEKRNITPIRPDVLDKIDKCGELLECKIVEKTASISFKTYKTLIKEIEKIINKLWK